MSSHDRVSPTPHRPLAPLILGTLFVGLLGVPTSFAATDEGSPSKTPETAIQDGNDHWAAGELEAAAADYRRAVELDPQAAPAKRKLGGVYLARHELTEAIEQFKAAIGLDPQDAGSFIGLGLAFVHQGKWGLAHAALSQAVEADPTRYEAVEPLMERIADRLPHPVPGDGTSGSSDFGSSGFGP